MGTVYLPAAVEAVMRRPMDVVVSPGTALAGENVHAPPGGSVPHEKLTGSENTPTVERSVKVTVVV